VVCSAGCEYVLVTYAALSTQCEMCGGTWGISGDVCVYVYCALL
jgi:hypothetical protein